MVHRTGFEAISEQIEIFCFLGLKLTRGFFKDFRDIRVGGSTKKSKFEKVLSNICGRIFQPKRSCLFWGEYTRQHVNLRDALTCEIHVSHDNKVCLFKLC